MTWTLQPQERDNQKYFFNGKCFMTEGAREYLSESEVIFLLMKIQKLASEKGGLDYIQTFINEDGVKIWFFDQLDEDMKKEHPPEHDYFTVLLPSER